MDISKENSNDKRSHGNLPLGEKSLNSLITNEQAKEIYSLKGI